ncbi:putative O-methyltransferase [Xylaria bambusicola]|uniref:putative O-methyltransferase n=1 Tax=Xylaria bambusicola TaxID=326684 RepID=UPI0020077895|nr:putative O-methyltransferase [Xylaria bambusicola]KAI0514347.1 putative O-methyltransferase [Xylaria bambusicola]
MASPPNTAVDIIEQLNDLKAKLSSVDDVVAKEDAVNLARQLVTTLEQPENIAVELAFSPFLAIAARIAVQLDLFKHIASHDKPVTSAELASLSGSEELLIIRILRPMAAIGFVKEAGQRKWTATPLTFAMATEEIASGHRMVGEMIVGAASQAPKYFKEAGYQCPTDPHDGLMQYAFRTKLTTFEFFKSMPEIFNDFNMFMGNTMGARHYWVDWFPVQDILLDGATNGSPLLVDVGGGKGHDVVSFHTRYPHQGRLVLQDLESVIESIEGLDSAIEVMEYNFFTEQPVEGARAYFYHHILHDWSDSNCLDILKRVKKAMTPGYSRLLIHEMIIPEEGASAFHAVLDMTMMAFNAAMERTERQWIELMERAGLKVVKVWAPPQNDGDGIIEVVLEE